jgi:hypothetical protein
MPMIYLALAYVFHLLYLYHLNCRANTHRFLALTTAMNLNSLRQYGAASLRSLVRSTHSQAANTVVQCARRPELFYHLIQPPTPLSPVSSVLAVSFLSQPLHNAESSAILGWVPAPSNSRSKSPEELTQLVSWRDFRENGKRLSCRVCCCPLA